jgi:hypothetical protein
MHTTWRSSNGCLSINSINITFFIKVAQHVDIDDNHIMNNTDNDGVALDEDLDAQDVEAATAQRAETQLMSGKVREAYYNSYAYLRDLQEFALDSRDMDLKRHIKCALSELDNFGRTLDIGYKWD